MPSYYNEIDAYCVQWLKNLIAEGLLPDGDVDDRDIREVEPSDLEGYTSCHFFAGLGGWPLALQMSGYTGPVWTGSCPCQPFSVAGKGKASGDERHLWPAWFELIRSCRPPTIFGEQVEAAIGWGWLDLVYSDLEKEGYAVGAAVLPACGVGAPHIRQRLWFVAESDRGRQREHPQLDGQAQQDTTDGHPCGQRAGRYDLATGELADANGGHASTEGLQRSGEHGCEPEDGRAISVADPLPAGWPQGRPEQGNGQTTGSGSNGIMGHTNGSRRQKRIRLPGNDAAEIGQAGGEATIEASPWSDLIWLPCTDGKQRPTQPGIFPLAHGVSNRVAKLRAAGNAIVPQVAVQFIKASIDSIDQITDY